MAAPERMIRGGRPAGASMAQGDTGQGSTEGDTGQGDMGQGDMGQGDAGQPVMSERHQQLRVLEALLFAAAEPLDEATLGARLPSDADLSALLQELGAAYANRGVHLVRSGRNWAFRTAPDMAPFLRTEKHVTRRLSPAAVETLAIIAYHQPVTRAEIEEIRGRSLSRGTLDVLIEAGWVRPRGRRRTPGRPVTWGTADAFLDNFGLESLDDLPGIEEIKAAGLLDSRPAIAAYGPETSTEEPDAEAPEAVGETVGEGAAGADPETDGPETDDPEAEHGEPEAGGPEADDPEAEHDEPV